MMVFKNNPIRTYILIFGVFLTGVLISNFTMNEPIIAIFVLSLGVASVLFNAHSKHKVREIIFNENRVIVKKYIRPFRISQEEYLFNDIVFTKEKALVGEYAWAIRIYGKDKVGTVLFVISTESALWEIDQLEEILRAVDYIRNGQQSNS